MTSLPGGLLPNPTGEERPIGVSVLGYSYLALAGLLLLIVAWAWITLSEQGTAWTVGFTILAVPLAPFWGASGWALLRGRGWGWWLAVIGNLVLFAANLLPGSSIFWQFLLVDPSISSFFVYGQFSGLVQSAVLLLVPIYLVLPSPRDWCLIGS